MRRFFGLGGDGGYRANAVRFDGSNDYLDKTNDLTGMADGKEGVVSFWINLITSTADQIIFTKRDAGAAISLQITYLEGTDKFRVLAANSAATTILSIQTNSTFTSASGWLHIIAAWNLATPVAHFFVNDVSDEVGGSTETDDTIDYTTGDGGVGIGANEDGTTKTDADIADFWLDDSFIDISVEANRRNFIDPNSNPVDLGETGQLPTGSSPIVYLSGPTTGWETNLGTGGGFTENGALTDGADSPSD